MGRVGTGGFGKAKRTRFLDRLAATCNVSVAARFAGVAVSSCYRLRAREEGFAAAWDAALAVGYDRLEAALLDYALTKMEGGQADPDVIAPAEIPGSVKAALAERSVSHSDLQMAVRILAQHRTAKEGKPRTKGLPSEAQSDAMLKRKLDALARRMKVA